MLEKDIAMKCYQDNAHIDQNYEMQYMGAGLIH